MRIAVAGATGTVGRHVVAAATERGHEVVALTRSAGVDLAGGGPGSERRLAQRLTGVDAVLDVTNTTTQSRRRSERFFGSVTQALLAAERGAGVGHHVALSIIGVDDVPSGYYAGKRLQERLLRDSDRPWSLLRAAQFHEFAEQALGFARLGPLSLVPVMRSQPVAAREVGEALVRVAEQAASGRVADLAGPEVLAVPDMAREVVRARGLRRRVVPVRLPGAAGRAMAGGALTAAGDPSATLGSTTFGQWLAEAASPGA
jgi:uncharacterized protein YbjT (DUF2867 family)